MSTHFNYVGVGLALRSSNGRTYGSVVLTESPDHSGALGADDRRVARAATTSPGRGPGADRLLQTHTAGLRDFDVQYRMDGGAWVLDPGQHDEHDRSPCATAPTATARLRVRATDRRGNVGAWSSPLRVYVP